MKELFWDDTLPNKSLLIALKLKNIDTKKFHKYVHHLKILDLK